MPGKIRNGPITLSNRDNLSSVPIAAVYVYHTGCVPRVDFTTTVL